MKIVGFSGTGQDELCSGRSSVRGLFERNFAEASASEFTWHWTQVTVRASTAVVAASLVIDLTIEDEPLRVPLRWTVALRRDAHGRWRWLHRHASAAAKTKEPPTRPTDPLTSQHMCAIGRLIQAQGRRCTLPVPRGDSGV